MTAFRLGIDFGTSHTVAMLRWPDGRVRPLLFDGSPLLPSAVYVDPDGALRAGRAALFSSRADPARLEPNPKRRIDEHRLLLGDTEVETVDAVAAVLGPVAAEAARTAGTAIATTVLTCPAGWGGFRHGRLIEAASRAGLGEVRLVVEPVAAAVYFTSILGNQIPDGSALVVYDFGGGTFDASVVRRVDGRFHVVASNGLDDVGGVDIDAAIVEQVAEVHGRRNPDAWAGLAHPRTPEDRRHRRMLWDDVRTAKELLSRVPSTSMRVPTLGVDFLLSRPELERIARPFVRRTVDLLMSTTEKAGVRPADLAGVFLVGGASRLPLCATMLHAALGVAPLAIEQPELVVAEGSLLADDLVGAGPAGPLPVPVPAQPIAAATAPAAMPPTVPPTVPIAVPAPVSGRRRNGLIGSAVVLLVLAAAVLAVVLRPDPTTGGLTGVAPAATAVPSAASAAGDFLDGGSITTDITEPRSLLPGKALTAELPLISALFTGLVGYEESGALRLELAESIESRDGGTWTIRIRTGWTFHDGSPVDAPALARGWNFVANSRNKQDTPYLFERVQGYAELAAGTASQLSGLRVVDAATLEVRLTAPFRPFPYLLGHPAFVPMASQCVADVRACESRPIGNGPFRIADRQVNSGIKLARFSGYQGPRPHLDGVELRSFSDPEAAYQAFRRGELDVLSAVPPARYAAARAEFGGSMVEGGSNTLHMLGFPMYLPEYRNPAVRRALALAIDRQKIVDEVFGGRMTPMTDLVAPASFGWEKTGCTSCAPDPTRAKELFAGSGWPAGKGVELWTNADGGHEPWLQPLCVQITAVLGVGCAVRTVPEYAAFDEAQRKKQLGGPYRDQWLADYPMLEANLRSQYATRDTTGATYGTTGYSNPAADALLAAGDTAATLTEAVTKYRQAARRFDEDVVYLQLWYAKHAAIRSADVGGIAFDPTSGLLYARLGLARR